MVEISKKTLWNLIRITRIIHVQYVKKKHEEEFLKSEFVDDRYPDLSWRIIYRRVSKGIFRNKFVVCDIDIKHKNTGETLFHFVDMKRDDDVNSKITWKGYLEKSDIKCHYECLYVVVDNLIRVI